MEVGGPKTNKLINPQASREQQQDCRRERFMDQSDMAIGADAAGS
jgi:hypothetical protein